MNIEKATEGPGKAPEDAPPKPKKGRTSKKDKAANVEAAKASNSRLVRLSDDENDDRRILVKIMRVDRPFRPAFATSQFGDNAFECVRDLNFFETIVASVAASHSKSSCQ